MSDPLSVAGTAVGITSLGIQVCQSLVKYLRAVKGRKEEISESVREVDRVVSLLSSLNSLLPRVGSANGSVQLRDCLKNCHAELKKIQTLLAELKGAQQSSKAMQRAANAMRSITYPFQQEKLTALRQSLRSVLDDLALIISILSLSSDATIKDTINTMSQDLKTHTSAQASGVSDLQTQAYCHSVQLRSLQSTISGTLDDITEQLHRTQLSIQDFDQRVDGKLTIIESGTQSIEASSQVTVAKLEEITKALASQSRLMENMNISVQIIGTQNLPNTDFATVEQNMGLQEKISKALYKQPANTKLWRSCHCASRIPKSKTFFSFWNMEFELEQQEHHLISCKLWGTKKGMKRTAKATFPLKLAWLSARTTLACFQYAKGTSQPSLSIRCTNIVPKSNSPVNNLCHTFVRDMHLTHSVNELIRSVELLEREILTLYTCGRASPGDIDEHGNTHAEIVFDEANIYWTTGFILQNNALTHAFLNCMRILLQAYDSDKDHFSFSRKLATFPSDPDPLQQDTINTKYLLSFMSQEACFSFSESVVIEISELKPSDSLKAVIQDTSEISDIVKAILSRSIENLELCVTQNPESVLESIHNMNVLYLSATWPEGLRYLLTTDAVTFIDDVVEIGKFERRTAISRVIDLGRAESVDILLGAGCCLVSGSSRFSNISSDQMAMTIAAHLSERRVRLLRFVQHQLGLFLDKTSVAFADSAAAEICAALDSAGVMIHPSLRVESDYRSIYSQGLITLDVFNCFWEKGFHHFKSHNLIGFTPIIANQFRLDLMIGSANMEELVEPMKWLVKKGFMQEKTRDPLGLGLNASATGYHYLGALLAQCASRMGLSDQKRRALNGLLARQNYEDDCMCWCNADNHGCSPLKLFLITYVHLTPASESETYYYRHVVLHHELLDLVTLGDTISHWIKGTLRLLTFEALEMTHTCCSFDHICKHDPSGLLPKGMFWGKGIFYHDPVSVSRIRSSAEEQSTAALLEELMVEFTEKLSCLTTGARAFEAFIFTHWRRRISQLYAPDPNAVEDLLQHQTFQGFGLSHPVRIRVLPETLQRLLGNDFLLIDHLDGSPSFGEVTSGVEEYEEPYCRWCNSDDESQSYDGSELGEEEKEEASVDDESD